VLRGEVSGMTSLVVVALIVLVAVLAPFFGHDSRPRC
jgi:hypothetical protein